MQRSFLKLLIFSVKFHLSPPIQVSQSASSYIYLGVERLLHVVQLVVSGSVCWCCISHVSGACAHLGEQDPPRTPTFGPGTSCWCIACIGAELLDNNLYFLEISNSGMHKFSPKMKPTSRLNCLITIQKLSTIIQDMNSMSWKFGLHEGQHMHHYLITF